MRVAAEQPEVCYSSRRGAMADLTGGRLLARNTLINLAGQGVPVLVALVALPILIKGLGTERFGVLTLAWIAIGYFSLFDLGLGRALTQLVSEKLAAGEEDRIPSLVRATLLLMLLLGLSGALLLLVLAPWMVRSALAIPTALQGETLSALYLLALSLPFVIGTTGLRGILEAQQRFGLVNAVRVPMGAFTFIGPVLVLPFSSSLTVVVAVLVGGRVVAWLAYLLLCVRSLPGMLRGRVGFDRMTVRRLLGFGGWMTVSNLVSPLMTYLDRFLIAAALSMAAVAYYVTPYEVVTKLWLVPGAVLGVLFPAFAASFTQNRARTLLLFERSFKTIFLALFPVILILVTLAPEGLDLWLGAEFAQNSTRVLQWLAVGVLINSIAQIPFTTVQGIGRPDVTAKLHLIELPLYLLALWWLIERWGIEGAAIAWVARVSLDLLVLLGVVERILPESTHVLRRCALALGAAVLTLGLAVLPVGLAAKGAFLMLVLVTFVPVAWFLVLSTEERALVLQRVAMLRGGVASSV
ncbi:MAG: oligosaccharide flippase family protein [Gemmatimonadetes bacterium]|nr:oligosaccharide flippase family protein [Gemmatimonadota bacterium]